MPELTENTGLVSIPTNGEFLILQLTQQHEYNKQTHGHIVALAMLSWGSERKSRDYHELWLVCGCMCLVCGRRVYYDTNHKEAWWGNRGHRRCRSLREGACDLHRPIWMRKKAPKKKLRRRSPNPVRGLPTVFFLNFWLIWSPNQLKKKSRSPNCLFLNRLGDLFNQVGRLL